MSMEIGLRILGRLPSNRTDGFFEQNGDSYKLKKNFEKEINWPAYSYTVKTNSLGLRDNKTGTMTIDGKEYFVFMGASETFANGVNYEDSFVGIVSSAALKNNINVLNSSVGGHYIIDQKALLQGLIQSIGYNPSKIFLCLTPPAINRFDTKDEDIIVKSGYLFGKTAWKIAYVNMMIANLSSAYCYFRENFRKLQTRLMHYDSSPKFSNISHFFLKTDRIQSPDTQKLFEDSMDEFLLYCKKNNITLVFVYLPIIDGYRLKEVVTELGEDPTRYDTSFHPSLLARYCKSRNVKLINLDPVLESYYKKGIQLRFTLDAHYNAFTNDIIGKYLISSIFENTTN